MSSPVLRPTLIGVLQLPRDVGPGVTAQVVQGSAALIPEFEALRSLASRVINEHVNDDGLCAVCGCAFPCELAVLAEHNLALF